MAESTPVVSFPRLASRGVLLGLSRIQVALVAVALVVFVLAEFTRGAAGVIAALPLWLGPIVLALIPLRGRPLVEWIPISGAWLSRRRTGSSSQRVRPTLTPPSSLTIPGCRGLTLSRTPDLGAGIVRDPSDSTLTAVLPIGAGGFLLRDADEQSQDVLGWGRLLGSLSRQPALVRLQVLVRAAPDGSAALRRWWQHRATGHDWSSRIVSDLVAGSGESATRREVLLAVRWRAPVRGRRSLGQDDLRSVEQHLTSFRQAAIDAGLKPSAWVGQAAIAGLLRTSFDPASVASRDKVESAGNDIVTGLAMEERWDLLRTDSAVHAVYWIREWPRTQVHAGFLQPLVADAGSRAVHRTLTIVAEPLPLGRALRDIRRSKVEHAADSARDARWGRVTDHTQTAEAEDVVRREQELVAGHAELRFVGLLVVSAPDEEQLVGACLATETAAAQALCDVRRLAGQQAAAFLAGGLPLARGAT